jgi:hypothetical protein
VTEPRTFSRPGKGAAAVLQAEMLADFRHWAQTSTEFMERLAGQTINNVLEIFSGVFDATGQFSRDYQVAAGALLVNNLGIAGHRITVSTAGPGSSAPTGTGTYLVDGGTSRTVPLASRAFTLYGTAADAFSIAVFTAAVIPGTA